MSKKDELLRYVWGCLTVACNDYADGLNEADEDTLALLLPVFDKLADAQQQAEMIYLNHASVPDIRSRMEATYLGVPEDLEAEIRAAMSVLLSSQDASTVLDAASAETKAFVGLLNRNRSFGIGASGVASRLKKRVQRLKEYGESAQGLRKIDTIPPEDREKIRAEVRAELEGKMLSAADRLLELREMIRAKRAELSE